MYSEVRLKVTIDFFFDIEFSYSSHGLLPRIIILFMTYLPHFNRRRPGLYAGLDELGLGHVNTCPRWVPSPLNDT
jgi:hypothetical protein